MKKKRRRFAVRPRSVKWLLGGIALLVAALWGLIPLMPHHRAAALVGYLLFLASEPPLLVGSRRYLITAGQKGCTEWLWPCCWRRHRWSDITAIEADDLHARITTTCGTLRLDPQVDHWLVLVEMAREQSGISAPELAAEVIVDIPAAKVASWLAMPVDGELVVRSGSWRAIERVGQATMALEALALVAIAYAAELPLLYALGALLGGFVLAMPWLDRRFGWSRYSVDEVRALADGLDVHTHHAGWQRYDWGSLKHLRRFGWFWVLNTPTGDLSLPRGLVRDGRLRHAIEQAIAARRRGEALPRMTGEAVPDSALSRAQTEDVSVERGLSVSEGGEG